MRISLLSAAFAAMMVLVGSASIASAVAILPGGSGVVGTVRYNNVNWALSSQGGVATMNSTGFGGVPSRGNDGGTDGDFGLGSVAHSGAGGPAEYWDVAFNPAAEYAINNITAFNRSDCCGARLDTFGFQITNSKTAAVSTTNFTVSGGIVAAAGVQTYPAAGFQQVLPANTILTSARLKQNGTDFLNFAELQANGQPNMTLAPTDTMAIDILGAAMNDFIDVEGTANFNNASLSVNLLNNFKPHLGDTFDVLTANTINPVGLPTVLGFGVSTVPGGRGSFLRLTLNSLTILPEPASMAVWSLVGLAGAAAAWRSRRRT